MAAGDILIFGAPGAKDDSTAYMVGYVGAFFLFDVAVAVVGHLLRRLFLRVG